MWKEFETLAMFVLLLCVGLCDLSPTLTALILEGYNVPATSLNPLMIIVFLNICISQT